MLAASVLLALGPALASRASSLLEFQLAYGLLVGFALVSLVGMPAQGLAVSLTFWTMAFWCVALAGAPPAAPLAPWLLDPLHVRSLGADEDKAPRCFPQ